MPWKFALYTGLSVGFSPLDPLEHAVPKLAVLFEVDHTEPRPLGENVWRVTQEEDHVEA